MYNIRLSAFSLCRRDETDEIDRPREFPSVGQDHGHVFFVGSTYLPSPPQPSAFFYSRSFSLFVYQFTLFSFTILMTDNMTTNLASLAFLPSLLASPLFPHAVQPKQTTGSATEARWTRRNKTSIWNRQGWLHWISRTRLLSFHSG